MSTRSYAHASGRHPKATRCSSRRWWRSFGRRRTERLLSRLRSRRCSPRASTSSNRMSGRCSSAARSKAGSSTGGRCRPWRPEEPQVMARLTALVRKELVRPDKPQLPGDDAFRFRHLLIRDAAYDALPKATRAELHARFAAWLEEHGGDLVELDEILGYHLEQAWRYRQELGNARGGELADAARRRLAAAGRRARQRQDLPAALNLFDRALVLAPSGEIDLALGVDSLEALFLSGQTRDAYLAAGVVAERAAATGDRVAELGVRIEEGVFRLNVEPEGAAEELAALVDATLPVFEDASDDLALYVAHQALGAVAFQRARMD